MRWKIIQGDCLEVMATFPENSIDAVICDPPYGLEFMNKDWDKLGATKLDDPAVVGGFQDGHGGNPYSRSRIRFGQSAKSMQQWHENWAIEAFRICKPGSHLVAFGGTRTHHRLMVAIEDAGWQIRDCLMWLYGSGFPKSHSIAMSIDKKLGLIGDRGAAFTTAGDLIQDMKGNKPGQIGQHEPISPEACKFKGYGSALKPAWEPIVLARKPLEGTLADNALEHGTGCLNVDGCRVGTRAESFVDNREDKIQVSAYGKYGVSDYDGSKGRWPANLILDEESAQMLDEQSGESPGVGLARKKNAVDNYGDQGGASRFFYTAKASRAERELGLYGHRKTVDDGRETPADNPYQRGKTERLNLHPTVKPLDLMRWLVRLISPPGAVILDPFCGSGTTILAARLEGMAGIGIELDADQVEISKKRLAHTLQGLKEADELLDNDDKSEEWGQLGLF